MFAIKKDVKAKWLEALRSGEYSQTKEVLKDDKGYCCLGVLCDLYAQETGVEWRKEEIARELGETPEVTYFMQNDCALLPSEVIEWAKIKTNYIDQSPWIDEINKGLVGLNDTGSSFIEIADVIEKYTVEVE